tara:strand:- start:1410 stop:3242 length:1833 start_codon:yes stop_codon:yes gene_type:complete
MQKNKIPILKKFMILINKNRSSKNFLRIRNLLILLNNLFLVNITLYLSYFLRLEKFINIFEISEVFYFVNLIYLLAHLFLNIENQYFRFFNTKSLKVYFNLSLIFVIMLSTFALLFRFDVFFPRSISIIFPTLLIFFLLIQRYFISRLFNLIFYFDNNNAVVIGFDIKDGIEISKVSNVKYYVDNKKDNIDRIFNGSKIIDLKSFLQNYKNLNFNKILIYDERLFIKIRNSIRDFIFDKNILVQRIHIEDNIKLLSYFDFNYLFDREDKFNKIKNEFEDKSILITGAGGSIGSGLVRQIENLKFKKLILIDCSEYNLFKLKEKIDKKNISFYLLNIEDLISIAQLIKEYKINLVIHAAAYKHVHLVEQNIFAAVKNNFINTHKLIELTCKLKVPYFCLISSDKAVRPTNVMGVTKRLAELSIQYHNKIYKDLNIFCVRFGNVINSSGSVLPIFKSQIDKGGPITITHKNIIRYFMTIEEASNLVLSSFKISKGGEIYLLDMGEPIKIYELAKKMIQFSGKNIKSRKKTGDVSIKIVGLRHGEKLFEELLVDDNSIRTDLNYIFQSIEKNLALKEYRDLYKNINKSFQEKNRNFFYKIISNNNIGYKKKKY